MGINALIRTGDIQVIGPPTSSLLPLLKADLAVSMVVDNATPLFGSGVTFTITANNLGPNDAVGVVVKDLLPSGYLLNLNTIPVSLAGSVGNHLANLGQATNSDSGFPSLFSSAYTVPAGVDPTQHPCILVWIEYQVSTNAGFDAPYAGGFTLTFGGVPMMIHGAPQTPVNPPYAGTHSRILGILPFDATTVFVGNQFEITTTSAQNLFVVFNFSAATALNVYPNSLLASLTEQDVGAVLPTNPFTLTTIPVSGGANDMLVAFCSGSTAGGAPWVSIGSPTFAIETVNQTGFITGLAYRSLSAPETDSVTFALTGVGAQYQTYSGMALRLRAFPGPSPSVGTYDPVTGFWAIGAFANGASATLGLSATVLGSGLYTNTATIAATSPFDPNPFNNTATTVVVPH